jgi:hypothetical protein
MAWRFRKSLKFGPLKVDLFKSIGGRGFRVGQDTKIEDSVPRQAAIFREDAK